MNLFVADEQVDIEEALAALVEIAFVFLVRYRVLYDVFLFILN